MTAYEREYLRWYTDLYHNPGKAFDPAPLVRAARAQWSDRPQLAEAFARCVRGWSTDGLYTWFLPPLERAGRWRLAGNLLLQVPGLGALVVDILHDSTVPGGLSIGGIEYLDRVMGHPTEVCRLAESMLAVRAIYRAEHGGS